VCFGSTSDTYDDTGKKIHVSDSVPESEAIEEALKKFIGTVDQIPPAYSAIHIDGKRAHSLARANLNPIMPTRKVCIQY